MTDTPTHAEVHDLLPAAALDTLDAAEAQLVFRHLLSCPTCTKQLVEYGATVAELGLLLDIPPLDAERSAALRARLVARAAAKAPRARRRRPLLLDRYAGWAVAAGLVGMVLLHHGFHRPLAGGWIVAGLLVLALVGLGIYAMAQHRALVRYRRK